MADDSGSERLKAGGGGDLAAGAASGVGGEASPGRAGGSGTGQPFSSLAGGAEFRLIRRFLDGVPPRDDVPVGPGDDAAVVSGSGIVLSSDLSVEDRHFRRSWMAPSDIGYRAAAASLSDLAAMAARPIGVLASLAVPAGEEEDAVEIMRGVRAAVESVGGGLLGGDLTSSPGPIFIDVVSVGQSSAPIRRSGAQPGDEVWVTGSLGGAALAVAELLEDRTPPESARERFLRPTPRVHEALWLSEREIPVAMLDISDGLGGDLAHLAAASGVAALIASDAIPLHSSLRSLEPDRALKLALSGGEDYEICFAARPGSVDPHLLDFQARFGCGLARVGRIEAGEGVHLEQSAGGERVALAQAGFEHFGDAL